MIEALLDVMKWPSWILHLSDCETGSTIAAIIVLGPRPIFHCTSSTALLWLPRTSQWTCGFGFSLLRMWAFHSTHSNSRRVNWPPQSLGRFTASRRGRRRLPGSRGSGPRGRGRGAFLSSATCSQAPSVPPPANADIPAQWSSPEMRAWPRCVQCLPEGEWAGDTDWAWTRASHLADSANQL